MFFAFVFLLFVSVLASREVSAINSFINLSIEGEASMSLAYRAPYGGFGKSSSVKVSVTSDYEKGYTLSITGPSDGRLVGKNNSDNYFESISSIISSDEFSGNNGTVYNNKWGFLSSKYYDNRKVLDNTNANNPNCRTKNCRNNNPNYLPAPTDVATVIDVTTEANPETANVYDLGFGARVGAQIVPDEYSGTFMITAISNVRVYQVSYEGFENTTGFPSFVVDGLAYTLSYDLKDGEYYNIYMNGESLGTYDYTVQNGVLTIPYVTGDIQIILQDDDSFTDHEPPAGTTVTGNGITITSLGSGVYEINGTSTREVFVRLSDYFFIANARADLIRDDAPADEAILDGDKFYELDVAELGGTQSATEDNQFRVVFREKGTVDVVTNMGYDFVSGGMGDTDTPIGVDVGMLSLYIKKDVVFDNFKFRIAIYEVDASAGPSLVLENEECGMSVSFYDQRKIVEYNGRTLKNCYVDLSARTGLYVVNPDTSGSEILYPAGSKMRIKYQYLSGYPAAMVGHEISFVFRNKNKTSSALAPPKLTTLVAPLNESATEEGVLLEDAAMFSGFVTYGITFNRFKFRISYEEVLEEDEEEPILPTNEQVMTESIQAKTEILEE